jgi:hypothetical protein
MGREGREYWELQLTEYWESGLTIQEYSELKDLPYESARRWIRVLQKARQADAGESESLELVEVAPSIPSAGNASGIKLAVGGIEIVLEKGFDAGTLSNVLDLIGARPCSASAVR